MRKVKDPPRGVRFLLKGVKRERDKEGVAKEDRHSSMYSSALSVGSQKIFDESVRDVDPINELALTRALIHEVLTSDDKGLRKGLPSLIRTVGELYDKIRRGVDGMRVVVSFKDGKFSRDVTEKMAEDVAKMLMDLSDGMCPECKSAFRANITRYVGEIVR